MTVQDKFQKWKNEAFCSEDCEVMFATELFRNEGMGEQIMLGLERAEEIKIKDQNGDKKQEHTKSEAKASVDMDKVARTLGDIKTGKRKFKSRDEALSLCKEMFDAGYYQAEAELKHIPTQSKRARTK